MTSRNTHHRGKSQEPINCLTQTACVINAEDRVDLLESVLDISILSIWSQNDGVKHYGRCSLCKARRSDADFHVISLMTVNCTVSQSTHSQAAEV